MRSCYPVFALTLFLAGAPAQNPPPKADGAAGIAVEAHFGNGSSVRLGLREETIEVITRFGKLIVPISDVRNIEFGIRLSPDTVRRLDEGITRLASPEFKQREAASAQLLKLGEDAYPALLRFAKNGDKEVARRAQELLAALRDKVPAERLRRKPYDRVETTEFTIHGRIVNSSLKAQTPYFGETQLKLADLRRLRNVSISTPSHKVTIDAAQHGGQQPVWLDTGIEVAAQQPLKILASGTVDLYPIAPEVGRYLATPAGLPGQAFPGFRGPGQGPLSPPGALMGRIGERGRVFFVGEKYDAPAADEGKLYLLIGASHWQTESAGAYTVKVFPDGE